MFKYMYILYKNISSRKQLKFKNNKTTYRRRKSEIS